LRQKKIPYVAINRLSIYYRCLERISEVKNLGDFEVISSSEMAEITGINSAQIRKDLAYFGEFGKRGVGYSLKNLSKELKNILGLDKKWPIIIVGAGNLGQALINYKDLEKRGFVIEGIFDNSPIKIGEKLRQIIIQDVKEIENFIKKKNIKIAVLTVPATSAQEVADRMIKGGIKAILNFAPIRIILSPEIKIHNVDLTIEFEGLTYYLSL
jgi:redox-sensing transcriptional repressor